MRRNPLWLLPLALIIGAAMAQNAPNEITPGEYSGEISDAAPSARYRFSAQAGDSIAIRMNATSGDLDPLLFLFGPDDVLLASNDDADNGVRDAFIAFTAEQSGLYSIEATRFDQTGGKTAGRYRLSLHITPAQSETEDVDPLSIPPSFGVPFAPITYEEPLSGVLTPDQPRQYYALGGRQGDFVRVVLRHPTEAAPAVAILNRDLAVISRPASPQSGQRIAFATLPQSGWYLIAVELADTTADYELLVERITSATLTSGQTVNGVFTPQAPLAAYVFDAIIGDTIFAALTTTDDAVLPEIAILDVNLQPIAIRQEAGRARIRAAIPRSGPYIIQIRDANENGGPFSLLMRQISVDVAKLSPRPITYNNRYAGIITANAPLDYYRFSGKAGELVTLQMSAVGTSQLDALLILSDANLKELASNDNAGATRDARITQFALPADGDYIVIASRPGLANGSSIGSYVLDITAGAIRLTPGAFSARLSWQGNADLNLFVRDPNGRTVSWSNPTVPSGGVLQVDSNTACITPSTEPVEYIYWPESALPAGDYVLWVWYQQDCAMSGPADFALSVTIGGQERLSIPEDAPLTLRPQERYEVSFRVTADGRVFSLNEGFITRPAPQQAASQGGDTLIVYGQSVIGTLNDEVFAQFYQFQGRGGESIIARAERLTGDLDPILVLRDAEDRNLALNDDADDGKNAQLSYTLPADGTYILAVTRYGLRDGTTHGDYRLTLGLDSGGE